MIAQVEKLLARFPLAAAILYGAVVVVLAFTAIETAVDLSDRRDAANAAADILGQIEGATRRARRALRCRRRLAVPGGADRHGRGRRVARARGRGDRAGRRQRLVVADRSAGEQSKAGLSPPPRAARSSRCPCSRYCMISKPGCRSCSSTNWWCRLRPARPTRREANCVFCSRSPANGEEQNDCE